MVPKPPLQRSNAHDAEAEVKPRGFGAIDRFDGPNRKTNPKPPTMPKLLPVPPLRSPRELCF